MANKTPLLYYYAHVYLPSIIFKNPKAFLGTINKGPETLESTLKKTFEDMKNNEKYELSEKNIELQQDDFSSSVSKITSKDISLLLIKFPKPVNTTEVAYVGITLEEDPKYFTLELHKPLTGDNRADKYFVCGWDKDGKHSRFSGEFSEPDAGLFAKAINDLYNLSDQTKE